MQPLVSILVRAFNVLDYMADARDIPAELANQFQFEKACHR